ncbi:hypothetical protein [Flammeovirga sp. EKP202]|uniref:hypothetical protein n=1 Tax=Flammeovirga sp. EKP202 TaxID=2770592 RepID=UPI00165FB8F1|nr:hypothetical protein [Flammeovirga sp. EKP202]MBD0400920.1 hypothetical protein [Flammeovirga sp. EKP202]
MKNVFFLITLLLGVVTTTFAQSKRNYKPGEVYTTTGVKKGYFDVSNNVRGNSHRIYFKSDLSQDKPEKLSSNYVKKIVGEDGQKWKQHRVQHPAAVNKFNALIPSYITGSVEVYEYGMTASTPVGVGGFSIDGFISSNTYYISTGDAKGEKLKRSGSKLKAQVAKYLTGNPEIIEKLNNLKEIKLESVFPLIVEYNQAKSM